VPLKLTDFPPEVHQSLSELRSIAQRAKNRDDPGLRRATEMELALAELLQQPWHCTGHSIRTGLPCRGSAVTGGTLCIKHGAQYSHVKKARDTRLQQLAGKALGEMYKLAMDNNRKRTPAMVKQRAAEDILDRAGAGALVEAKVRHSFHGQMSTGVTVQIGFLQQTLVTPSSPVVELGPHGQKHIPEAVEAEVVTDSPASGTADSAPDQPAGPPDGSGPDSAG